MGVFEIFILAIALGMDSFSVSICEGLSMKKINWKTVFSLSFCFGFFQALMPCIGFLLGNSFEKLITQVDHWIAFLLLVGVGINFLKESFKKEEVVLTEHNVDLKMLFSMGIATSIDALAVGITFSFLEVNLLLAVSIIGVTAFAMSFAGALLGKVIGERFNQFAKQIGGIILILIGLKILVEHLFF